MFLHLKVCLYISFKLCNMIVKLPKEKYFKQVFLWLKGEIYNDDGKPLS